MPKDEFDRQDPMELVGIVLPGEPGQLEAMAECIIEEYVRMGWSEKRLMTIFCSPMFLATYRIYREKGETYVRELIRRTCAKWVNLSQGDAPAISEIIPTKCALVEEIMEGDLHA